MRNKRGGNSLKYTYNLVFVFPENIRLKRKLYSVHGRQLMAYFVKQLLGVLLYYGVHGVQRPIS